MWAIIYFMVVTSTDMHTHSSTTTLARWSNWCNGIPMAAVSINYSFYIYTYYIGTYTYIHIVHAYMCSVCVYCVLGTLYPSVVVNRRKQTRSWVLKYLCCTRQTLTVWWDRCTKNRMCVLVFTQPTQNESIGAFLIGLLMQTAKE